MQSPNDQGTPQICFVDELQIKCVRHTDGTTAYAIGRRRIRHMTDEGLVLITPKVETPSREEAMEHMAEVVQMYLREIPPDGSGASTPEVLDNGLELLQAFLCAQSGYGEVETTDGISIARL